MNFSYPIPHGTQIEMTKSGPVYMKEAGLG